jgi:hypothetical protein
VKPGGVLTAAAAARTHAVAAALAVGAAALFRAGRRRYTSASG